MNEEVYRILNLNNCIYYKEPYNLENYYSFYTNKTEYRIKVYFNVNPRYEIFVRIDNKYNNKLISIEYIHSIKDLEKYFKIISRKNKLYKLI